MEILCTVWQKIKYKNSSTWSPSDWIALCVHAPTHAIIFSNLYIIILHLYVLYALRSSMPLIIKCFIIIFHSLANVRMNVWNCRGHAVTICWPHSLRRCIVLCMFCVRARRNTAPCQYKPMTMSAPVHFRSMLIPFWLPRKCPHTHTHTHFVTLSLSLSSAHRTYALWFNIHVNSHPKINISIV